MATADDYEECRVEGHNWTRDLPTMDPPSYGWRDCRRCERCSTPKHRIVDRYGYAEPWRYDYPEGYLQVGEKIERNDMRVSYFTRTQGPPADAPVVKPKPATPVRKKAKTPARERVLVAV